MSKNKRMTLAELVCVLQDYANQGLAQYEVDLDLETHYLCGCIIDHEKEIFLLQSEEKK